MAQGDKAARRGAERRASSELLQAVIDGLPEAVVVIERDHRVVLAYRAVRDLIGGDPVARGMSCQQILHGSDRPCEGPDHVCTLQAVLSSKAPVSATHQHVDAEGRVRFVELVAAPILSEEGEVVHIVESGRDVTERLRAEEERRRLEARVQEAQKLESLVVLAGGAADDFSSLLTVILDKTHRALRELPPESPAVGSLKDIESAAARAAFLAEQMLEFSGRNGIVPATLDLNQLVQEMSLLLEVALRRRIVVRLDLSRDLPAIEASEKQIGHLLMNLITNASEAMGEDRGVISVQTRAVDCEPADLRETLLGAELPAGRYLRLAVKDTGCGMDAETRQKMFEPFFTTRGDGRGLGMAAALGIVRAHRGAFEILSEPGRGTTIGVLLPVASRHMPDDAPSRAAD